MEPAQKRQKGDDIKGDKVSSTPERREWEPEYKKETPERPPIAPATPPDASQATAANASMSLDGVSLAALQEVGLAPGAKVEVLWEVHVERSGAPKRMEVWWPATLAAEAAGRDAEGRVKFTLAYEPRTLFEEIDEETNEGGANTVVFLSRHRLLDLGPVSADAYDDADAEEACAGDSAAGENTAAATAAAAAAAVASPATEKAAFLAANDAPAAAAAAEEAAAPSVLRWRVVGVAADEAAEAAAEAMAAAEFAAETEVTMTEVVAAQLEVEAADGGGSVEQLGVAAMQQLPMHKQMAIASSYRVLADAVKERLRNLAASKAAGGEAAVVSAADMKAIVDDVRRSVYEAQVTAGL